MKPQVTKEAIEPIAGPDMVHHDDFISQHEQDGFKHHSDTYGKEAAGHKKHAAHIKSFCKGGKSA